MLRISALSILVLCGCASPPEGFGSPNPGAQLDAITDAAAQDDRTHLRELIECLDSDDPAVRMVSILTLERLTGQTHGYDYAAEPWQREPAVQAWAEWYRQGAGKPGGHGGADIGAGEAPATGGQRVGP